MIKRLLLGEIVNMNFNATIIGQSISFIFFVFICMNYIWPNLINVIETRQKNIKNSFLEIEIAKRNILMERKKLKEDIKKAKKKVSEIIDLANKNRNLILEEAKRIADKKSKKIIDSARNVIEIESFKANEDLRKKLGVLSISIAKKILNRSISKKEHYELINKAMSEF
ncbi:F0F1 ATP synthase subunit B [Buchnera aphidicola]|uniref:F0F1 ATP synthase subunit B n=1 Tax=Buchnera aphidicola TaxID=9 RepID=UPI003463CB93